MRLLHGPKCCRTVPYLPILLLSDNKEETVLEGGVKHTTWNVQENRKAGFPQCDPNTQHSPLSDLVTLPDHLTVASFF